jgi:hypothetical protein
MAIVSEANATEIIRVEALSGRKMPEYRAYIMRSDGRVFYRVDLVCKDEATAKERAKALVDEHDIELWQLDRLIEPFKHEG